MGVRILTIIFCLVVVLLHLVGIKKCLDAVVAQTLKFLERYPTLMSIQTFVSKSVPFGSNMTRSLKWGTLRLQVSVV